MTPDHAVGHRCASASSRLPFVIGLTGPIAAGKSTVAGLLRQRGAEVIDADRVYRSLLVPGSMLWQRLKERFGPSIVGSAGEIDRAALANIVFSDPKELADLDRITHPAVVAEIRDQIAQSSAPLVVLEAVKLVQSGLTSDVDALWFITADADTRMRRLVSRSGMDEAQAQVRIDAAPETVPEGVRFDATIDTSGDLASTASAVDDAWRSLGFGQAHEQYKDLIAAEKECS
jgi:dephospho-CoA kinase